MNQHERELEDYICQHAPQFFGHDLEIIGRQIHVPHGIIDILAWDGWCVRVIELKVRPLCEKDITQVFRYVADVKRALRAVGLTWFPDKRDGYPQALRDLWMERCGFSQAVDAANQAVLPVLVGPSIEQRALATADGSDCYVYLWKQTASGAVARLTGYHGGDWQFDEREWPRWLHEIADRIVDYCAAHLYASLCEGESAAKGYSDNGVSES